MPASSYGVPSSSYGTNAGGMLVLLALCILLSGAAVWLFARIDNGVGTQIGANVGTQLISNGDSVGAEVVSGGTFRSLRTGRCSCGRGAGWTAGPTDGSHKLRRVRSTEARAFGVRWT